MKIPFQSGILAEVAVLPCQPPEDDIGLDVWPATTLLCRYLADNPSLVRSAASVLELGSGEVTPLHAFFRKALRAHKETLLTHYLGDCATGVGVAGILAIVLGAARITLTDYDAQVELAPIKYAFPSCHII